MEEIWKDIEGYEGLYQVSNEGKVRSCEREIEYLVKGKYKGKRVFPSFLIKPWENNSGYVMVDLHKNGKTDKRTIHRLVAEAFIPNIENKPCVDHINTIKTDNRVQNLRWCTYKENINNPITNGKQKNLSKKRDFSYLHNIDIYKKISKSLKGHKMSDEVKNKISESNSKPIYQYSLEGELITVYKNSVEASKKTGFPQAQINKYAHGKYYSKQRNKWYYKNEYKGYKWSFNPL